MNSKFLTIDCGGTMTKVLLYDAFGTLYKSGHFETMKIIPKSGYAEIDLMQTWDKLLQTIKSVIDGEEACIQAISTVGHGKGLYLWGEDGIINNGILSVDTRGYEMGELTPSSIFPSSAPNLLSWFKVNQPEVYKKIRHVFSAKDWIGYMLSGVSVTDYTDVSSNGWLNFETNTYDDSIIRSLDIEDIRMYLPKIVPSDCIIGLIKEDIAHLTGLPKDVKIVNGMFDVDACALASKVLDDSYMSVTAGTWSVNVYVSQEPTLTTDLLLSKFVDGFKYLIESSSPTSAGNLKIMIELLFPNESKREDIYEWIEHNIVDIDLNNTELLFFPFLYGTQSKCISSARFIGLNTETTQFMLIRSVYEGIVFAHRYHIEKLDEQRGVKLPVRLSGGAVNSEFWVQMFADILGRTIEVCSSKEMGGLGGAIICAKALEHYPTLELAASQMTSVLYSKEPNLKKFEEYQGRYSIYKEMIGGSR